LRRVRGSDHAHLRSPSRTTGLRNNHGLAETPRLPTASRIAIWGTRGICFAETDLIRGLGRDRQNGNTRAMTVEQTIDEVKIAGAAAPGANSEPAGKVRLGAGCQGGNFLMAEMGLGELICNGRHHVIPSIGSTELR
jgi:hypothetical protein